METSYINLGTLARELEAFIIDLEDGIEEGQSEKALKQGSRDLAQLRRDGVSAATVHSPASEEAVEVCKDEDSAKDDNIANDSEATDHSVCDQDHPNGQENDSVNNEIKIEEESQSSYMETEELSSNQEDTTIVEQPEVVPLTDVQEEKGGEKGKKKLMFSTHGHVTLLTATSLALSTPVTTEELVNYPLFTLPCDATNLFCKQGNDM
ncbi:MACRO domain-containing protein 2 [Myotis brandtii]|uniref:MACRO domain-containing protein 2 n=1 Tax=Myotis brandtii TaxID=109478 RepID=S7P252_MYOBR|nr:MACRO domain-containing protein 2 [Myotis brandtii]